MQVHRIRIVALLFAASWGTSGFAQTAYRGCAIADVSKILSVSKSSKAAQAQLAAEFEPKFDSLTTLASARNLAERALLDAKLAARPATEVSALRTAYDAALATETAQRKPYMDALQRRRSEALQRLMDRVNEEYRRLGDREKYARLYQKGESEPVFTLGTTAQTLDCGDKVDVTDALIHQIDTGQ